MTARRADAVRNRERLLAAARAVFDEQGVGAPLDEVARRAGVGNATMYRHFADRRELALAVYADQVDALCRHGSALLAADAPLDALFEWLAAFATHVATKRELAMVEGGGSGRYADWHAAMHRTAGALVERARAAGRVRADLAAADLLLLCAGIGHTGADPERAGRLLDLVRDGVTAGAPAGNAATGNAATGNAAGG
jgi:AcrR family transcriptional regulator